MGARVLSTKFTSLSIKQFTNEPAFGSLAAIETHHKNQKLVYTRLIENMLTNSARHMDENSLNMTNCQIVNMSSRNAEFLYEEFRDLIVCIQQDWAKRSDER